MSSYTDMQTRIRNELKRGNLQDEIQTAIISALEHYKARRFRFNIARATAQLTAGIEYYGLPDDFIELDTAVLRQDNQRYFLRERSHFWIDKNQSTVDYQGTPDVISVQADEFRMYPIPGSTSYSVEITYCYYPYESTTPSASDASAWFNEGEELIRTHAKADILENVIRGSESLQEAQVLRGREFDIYKRLSNEYKRSQSSGMLTPH